MDRRSFVKHVSCGTAALTTVSPALGMAVNVTQDVTASTYSALLGDICKCIDQTSMLTDVNRAAEAMGYGPDLGRDILRALAAHSAVYDFGESIATDRALSQR